MLKNEIKVFFQLILSAVGPIKSSLNGASYGVSGNVEAIVVDTIIEYVDEFSPVIVDDIGNSNVDDIGYLNDNCIGDDIGDRLGDNILDGIGAAIDEVILLISLHSNS